MLFNKMKEIMSLILKTVVGLRKILKIFDTKN